MVAMLRIWGVVKGVGGSMEIGLGLKKDQSGKEGDQLGGNSHYPQ